MRAGAHARLEGPTARPVPVHGGGVTPTAVIEPHGMPPGARAARATRGPIPRWRGVVRAGRDDGALPRAGIAVPTSLADGPLPRSTVRALAAAALLASAPHRTVRHHTHRQRIPVAGARLPRTRIAPHRAPSPPLAIPAVGCLARQGRFSRTKPFPKSRAIRTKGNLDTFPDHSLVCMGAQRWMA